MILQNRNHRGLFVSRNIFVLSFVNLFLALAGASITSIWSLYVKGFAGSDSAVGLISGALTLVSFVSYFLFVPLVQKSRKSSLFVYSLVLVGITYLLFYFNRSFILFLLLAVFITAVYTIRTCVFGIIVRDKSKIGDLSQNEGFIYTFINLGWVVGPLIGGYVASLFGNNAVFLFSFFFCFFALMTFLFSKVEDRHHDKKATDHILSNFLEFFKDKKRLAAYVLRGGAFLWWTLIYVFMPLYIIEQGLSKVLVGYFLFSVAVPLIVSEYIFSKMAKRYGYGKIFMFGFSIAFVFAIASFFASNIFAVLILVMLAGFGIAMLEPTTEAYFLEVANIKDISRFYGPFNTSVDVMQFSGKIISSLVLFILPFKFLFLLFAVFMLIMAVFASRIRK